MRGDTGQYRVKYILGLTILIAAAFVLPRLLFALQDRERMREIGRGNRAEINFTALAEDYEGSLALRLGNFAKGLAEGREYYVSEMSFQLSDDQQIELLKKTLSQAPLHALQNVMQETRSWYINTELLKIEDWKKYVIYDSEGVRFLCWYADISLASGQRMQMLLDAENGILYCLQGQSGDAERREKKWNTAETTNKSSVGHRGIAIYWLICGKYYEYDVLQAIGMTDAENSLELIDTAKGQFYVADVLWQLEEIETNGVDWYEVFAKTQEKEAELSDDRIAFSLRYGDETLPFEMWIANGASDPDRRVDFFAGIPDIARLIPEMGE